MTCNCKHRIDIEEVLHPDNGDVYLRLYISGVNGYCPEIFELVGLLQQKLGELQAPFKVDEE